MYYRKTDQAKETGRIGVWDLCQRLLVHQVIMRDSRNCEIRQALKYAVQNVAEMTMTR